MQHWESPTDRELLYGALLTISLCLRLIYRLWRQTRYADELYRRERQKRIDERTANQKARVSEANAIQTRLLKIFFSEQQSTVQRLANDTDSGFKLKR